MKPMSLGLGLVLAAVFLASMGLPQSAACAADTTPPTGTIVINNNRSATDTPSVTLALTWADNAGGSGVSRMRFSNDGSHWTAWEELAATRAYTLPGGDGHKTVRVQYLDKSNNRSAVFKDYILLDTAPPTGSIIINSGDQTAMTQSVTLGLAWSDAGVGVSRMRFSDDGAHWTAWMPPTATRAHTLPAELGYHTVRVQYLDGLNHYSPVYSDYIKLVGFSAGTSTTVMLPGSVPLEMMWIPAGTYMMGSYPDEQDSNPSQVPQHAVTLTGFWMGKYELTKRQWTAVMNTAPWTGLSYVLADPDSPAIYISWNSAQAFLTALNSDTGKTFRLPSEAQWEYACRAGTLTRFYWSDDPGYSELVDYAWCYDNAYNVVGQQFAHVVGKKTPNAFGLYDMSGNVWEWCQDCWHSDYTGAPANGSAWVLPSDASRVLRGGSWDFNGPLTSDYRSYGNPSTSTYHGFGCRIVQIP